MSETALAAPPVAARSIDALTREMAALLGTTLGDAAHREARELLAALHDMPRHWPVVARDALMDCAQWDAALAAAMRRAAGAPLQYAAGLAAFRHLSLHVDERVLIPRPETEQLVELVLAETRAHDGGTVVDVGTGSGAIALALASEGRFDRVIATDVSLDALDVASANATRCTAVLRAPVELRHGSLLAPVPERGLRVVVSNPPYIAFAEAPELPSAVRDWEPAVALFSGDGGLALTQRLMREAAGSLVAGGLLALEVDARRARDTAALAMAGDAWADVQVVQDLTGRERFVVARRREEQR